MPLRVWDVAVVVQSLKLCPTLFDPMDFSMPGFPVLQYLPDFAQLISSELVIPSNHLIHCRPLLLLPSIYSSIRVFSSELAIHIRWPKYWSFSFSISLSNEYSGLTSFRLDWFDFFAVKGLSRVLSITTGRRHQFFGTRPSLRSNPHIHMWLLEKPLCNHCQKLWPHLLPSSPADFLTPN